jgi:hypothetical protein
MDTGRQNTMGMGWQLLETGPIDKSTSMRGGGGVRGDGRQGEGDNFVKQA